MIVEFTIPIATPTLNEWQRMHWQKRRRTNIEMAWQIRAALGKWTGDPIKDCSIYIERHGSRLVDWDGVYGGLKPLLDALVKNTKTNPHGLGIIEDDSPNVVKKIVAVQKKSTRKGCRTLVRIIENEESVPRRTDVSEVIGK